MQCGTKLENNPFERTVPPPASGNPRSVTRYSIVAILTFSLMIMVFLYSFDLLFSVFASTIKTTVVAPYFFIFLYEIASPYSFGIIWLLLILFALYVLFFVYMLYSSSKQGNFKTLDSPMAYFVFVSCASLLLSIIIILFERGVGIQIGGTGIETATEQNPLLGYTSLIYAPFVEELGFRILPLGILSAVIVGLKARTQGLDSNALKDSLIAIVNPGSMRKKHGIQFGAIDWILIIATSVIFAYAHIYFGGWDWGKFAQTFVFGMLVAIGFLKFGVYVDVPMHWVANGIAGIIFLNQDLLLPVGFLLLWLLAIGIMGLILLVSYASKSYKRSAAAG